jgi:hypothetical protein
MLDRIDSRWLRQLVYDNNTVATEEQFLASGRVAALLSDAAGKILASALQGQRYLRSDLDGLTGDGLNYLIALNVYLAAGGLACVRQIPADKIAETLPQYGEALATLQQLQLGNVIFDVAASADAGLPHTQRFARSTIVCGALPLFGNVYPCGCPPTCADTESNCCN